MSALAQQWGESLRFATHPQSLPWLDELRLRAVEQLAEHGLPHRKDEDWKYTPLRVLEQLNPAITTGTNGVRLSNLTPALLDSADCVIRIHDGALAGTEGGDRPGVSVLSLSEGLKQHESLLRKHIESVDINGSAQAFAALNTASLDQGLVIHVKEQVDAGTVLLRWTLSATADPVIHNFRIFLFLGEGSRMQLVEQYESADHGGSALNVVSHFDLDKDAVVDHLLLQNESENTILLSSTQIEQAQGSRYNYSGFDLGGGLVRHELKTVLAGSGAQAAFGGAFVLDNSRHVDNHISVEHAGLACSSDQFFRGVLGGRSRGVFNGKALIRPGADESSVRQSNANLLLSPLAQIDTKPELEIYADEVEASHGATVGQLDEAAIFYLRSRGLSEAEARQLLVGAFCRAVTDRLENREVAARISARIDRAMPTAGVGFIEPDPSPEREAASVRPNARGQVHGT